MGYDEGQYVTYSNANAKFGNVLSDAVEVGTEYDLEFQDSPECKGAGQHLRRLGTARLSLELDRNLTGTGRCWFGQLEKALKQLKKGRLDVCSALRLHENGIIIIQCRHSAPWKR